jgi:hypothetical protein
MASNAPGPYRRGRWLVLCGAVSGVLSSMMFGLGAHEPHRLRFRAALSIGCGCHCDFDSGSARHAGGSNRGAEM